MVNRKYCPDSVGAGGLEAPEGYAHTISRYSTNRVGLLVELGPRAGAAGN